MVQALPCPVQLGPQLLDSCRSLRCIAQYPWGLTAALLVCPASTTRALVGESPPNGARLDQRHAHVHVGSVTTALLAAHTRLAKLRLRLRAQDRLIPISDVVHFLRHEVQQSESIAVRREHRAPKEALVRGLLLLRVHHELVLFLFLNINTGLILVRVPPPHILLNHKSWCQALLLRQHPGQQPHALSVFHKSQPVVKQHFGTIVLSRLCRFRAVIWKI